MAKPIDPNDSGLQEFLEEWDRLMIQLRALDKAHKEYEHLREKFCKHYAGDVIELTLDFFPDLVGDRKVLYNDLLKLGTLILDDVSDMTFHYEEGKEGYRFGLYIPKFELRYISEDEKAKFLSFCKNQDTWELLKKKYDDDYVDSFYFQSFRWHLFKLIKKLVPEYYNDVFDLPAQGFRELEGFLYISMLDTFEVIVETQHGEPYFNN